MLVRCVTADALFVLAPTSMVAAPGSLPLANHNWRAAFSDWNDSSAGTFTSSSISGQTSC